VEFDYSQEKVYMAFGVFLPVPLLYPMGINRVAHLVLAGRLDELPGSLHIQFVHWSNGNLERLDVVNDQNNRSLGASTDHYDPFVHAIFDSLGSALERHVCYCCTMG